VIDMIVATVPPFVSGRRLTASKVLKKQGHMAL